MKSIGINIDGTLTSPIYCGYVESKYGVIFSVPPLPDAVKSVNKLYEFVIDKKIKYGYKNGL